MAEETKIEGKVEEKTKKNMSWKYDSVGHTLTAIFPSGTEKNYNLSSRVNGMAFSDELIYQYGMRQWLSSNASALKEEDEKIDAFRRDFSEFMEKGLELSEGGQKISVVGRERANATGAGESRKLAKEVKHMIDEGVSLTGLLLKKQLKPDLFTEEDEKKLQELLVAAATMQK